MIICSSITWYNSSKDEPDDDGIPGDSDVTEALWWTLRYHLGTVAFGSLIMTIVTVIRIVFEYVAKKIQNSG